MGAALTQLSAGVVFANDYRVVRPLAVGGMGAVYVVEQLSTDKPRALKLMHPELLEDEGARRRFEQEARVGSRIQSEHVVEIFGAGVDAETGTPYLVMELLVGEDLATALARRGAMTPAHALRVLEQIGHAVGAAHAAGIVHRDLKPENVFLAKVRRASQADEDEVKVLDFGIAKLTEESATRKKTTGVIGTPLWMAPEQTEAGVVVTPAADVWALGLIAYFLLTGRSYWLAASVSDTTVTQLMREVLMGPLPPASARAVEQGVGATIPVGFDSVFARAVCRDASRRFPDADAFTTALREALRAAPGPAAAGPASAGLASADPASAPSRVAALDATAPPDLATHAPAPAGRTAFQPPLPPPSARRDDKTLLWILLALVAAFVIVPFPIYMVRRAIQSDRARAVSTEPDYDLDSASPSSRSTARPQGPVCPKKACTVSVVATGGLDGAAVTAAAERGFYRFDECLRTGRVKPRGGTVVLRFRISGGMAVNRRVEAADTTGGLDQCVERELADVPFPAVAAPTDVTYTLTLNPAGA